jgi:adenylate cyclase
MQYARDAAKRAGRPEGTNAAGVEAEAARAQLARILASAGFDASERNRRFLRYVVEQTLAGRGDRIKAYDVAVTVFGRDDSFDPQSDPIVRIEASRLRRSLERYYLLAGRDDPVRIEVPKGGYVPAFYPQSHTDDGADALASAPDRRPPGAQDEPVRSQVAEAPTRLRSVNRRAQGPWRRGRRRSRRALPCPGCPARSDPGRGPCCWA